MNCKRTLYVLDTCISVLHKSILPFLTFLYFLISCNNLSAQDYILASGYYGSSSSDRVSDYIVDNNFLYIIGATDGTNFVTTDGSVPAGSADYYFLKYDALTMNLLEARLYGSPDNDYPYELKLEGSNLYVIGVSSGSGLPSTTGPGHSGGSFNGDVHVLKLDLNGNVAGGTYLGGTLFEEPHDVEVSAGKAHLVIGTASPGFPVTNGTTYGGAGDIAYVQVDLASMGISFSTFIGDVGEESYSGIDLDGTTAYIAFMSSSTALPITDGTANSGIWDLVVASYDINAGSLLAMTYLGGSDEEEFVDILAEGGNVFIEGNTYSTDFPVTNGTSKQSQQNMVFAHYDANLNRLASTYILDVVTYSNNLEYHNGYLYTTAFEDPNVSRAIAALKLDMNGNVIWEYGGIQTSSKFSDLQIHNDKVHVVTSSSLPTLVTTNGSFLNGSEDFYYTVLTLAGDLEFASFYGGVLNDNTGSLISKDWLQFDGSKTWIAGSSENCFPITNGSSASPSSGQGEIEIVSFVIETCATDFEGDPNPTPASQEVCKNGFVVQIVVDPYIVSGAVLPPTDVCGATVLQRDIEAEYQWQSAPSSSGPWTDLPGAIKKNYTPIPLSVTTCFRRLAKETQCCGGGILQTSTVHCVNVGVNNAPAVDAGGLYNTCPGTPVTMSSTVTGGTPPYQYQWAAGNSTTIIGTAANQTVTPSVDGATIYTVTVTDANNCRQLDQSIVNAYAADAGPDVSFCENQPPPSIGGTAIPGLAGVAYGWTPPTGLSCTNCPNPIASPTSVTTYTVTLTIPVTGGTTCSTTDQVTVSPIVGPNVDFAGPDQVICFGTTTMIGNAPETGFDYTWAPGSYLVDNMVTPTTFDHGNLSFPNPNPITYFLTAEKEGCTWYDQTEVAVIRAEAGIDGCGPRIVGFPDATPNINETYLWTKVSGSGTITGPTNTPQTTVSATPSGNTVYRLTVSYMGTTCVDQVNVPQCGCNVLIGVLAGIGCPSNILYDDVCMQASPVNIPAPYTISWSPSVGLDTAGGPVVCLTDNVPRIYTATITSDLDPTVSCSAQIEVNDPAWSEPDFTAQDPIVCPDQPVSIGEPNVAGYSYVWLPQNNLNNNMISNPTATVPSTTNFTVVVEDVLSGCRTKDTATVTVASTFANAGPDQVVCNAGVLTLGTPPVGNTTYSWTPANANWQNGTNQNSPQPDVLVAINTTFILTATSTLSGCTDIDTVEVTVGQPVPPFILPNVNYCPSAGFVQIGNGAPTGLGLTYSWSPTTNMNNPNIAMPVIDPAPPNGGVYTLIVTNASGCSYQQTQLLRPQLPTPIVAGAQVLCVGETANIGSNSNPTGPGTTYSWSPGIGLSSTTSPNPVFTASNTGIFTYTLTVTVNGCSNTAMVNIVVNDFEVNVGPSTVCEGGCALIGIPPVLGATYNWAPTTGLDDPTSSNPLACVNVNTIYTLTATGPNGCQDIVQVPVFVNPSPAPQVTIPPLNYCIGFPNQFLMPSVTPPGSYIYKWEPNNGTLIYPSSPSPEVIITTAGTYVYSVTVTNATSGCATVATTTVIAVAECAVECEFTLDLVTEDLACNGDKSGSIDLTPMNGAAPIAYDWSNGANTEDIGSLAAGTYTVTAVDADGCIATGSAVVREPDRLTCMTTVVQHVSSNGGNDGIAQVAANGGEAPYGYMWDVSTGGQTTAIATGLSAGFYLVSVSDDSGCNTVCNVNITEPDAPCDLCSEAENGSLDICVEILTNPSIGTLDCDNGGIINSIECDHMGDPLDPEDDCSIAETAGVDICAEIGGDPNHPLASQDCDNGGVINIDECNGGDDPFDPSDDCQSALDQMLNICALINYDPMHPLASLDCDEGGVTNIVECNGGGDPSDPDDDCWYAGDAGIDICVLLDPDGDGTFDDTHPWANLDCDDGGIPNIVECITGDDPSDPSDDSECYCEDAAAGTLDICALLDVLPNHPAATLDCDNGGVINNDECNNNGDPNDPDDECTVADAGNIDICALIAGDVDHPLALVDCDNGGVFNIDECNGGDDPFDPMDDCQSALDQGLNLCAIIGFDPTHPLANLDCDSGGVINITECNTGDDPSDPDDDCHAAVDSGMDICAIIAGTTNHPWASLDCDDGSVDNQTECDRGTDPSDPSDDITCPIDYCEEAANGTIDICAVINGDPNHPAATLDCDNGGVINIDECNNNGDPNDPDDECTVADAGNIDICALIAGDVDHPLAQVDCDNGGVLNIDECNGGDDPFDPSDDCQSALDQGINICVLINLDPMHPLATLDCDNGGVDNIVECENGGDPSDPDDDCQYAGPAGIDICVLLDPDGDGTFDATHPWATLDCDDGGVINITECITGDDPNVPSDDPQCLCDEAANGGIDICMLLDADPTNPIGSLDCDNGGIDNQTECDNNGEPNDPEDDCQVAITAGEDLCAIINGDPDHPLASQDCDNGGVPNIIECDNNGDPTDPVDDCSVAKAGGINICILINWDPMHPLATLDCDNGGVDNITECNNGLDACDPGDDCVAAVRGGLDICAIINGDPNHPWASLDCDNGSVMNIVECNDGRDPSDPSDDIICEIDFCKEAAEGNIDICITLDAEPDHPLASQDCDNGGVINSIECGNNGDPNDPMDDCSIAITADLDICAMINGDPNHPLANQDCDNGGVINIIECNSGEDPTDPADDCQAAIDEMIDICLLIGFDPTHPMSTLDCDNGGIDNFTECANGNDPTDPIDDCDVVIDEQIDVCSILTNDPNNPLGTQDCDGDGVINGTECTDMTDPLDPCDFDSGSITLPVTADQSDCENLCPDLTPIVTILPGNIAGLSAVGVAVEISEINGIDTDGSDIKVRMPSDPRLVFVWDLGLTFVALTNVQNADWNYLGDNGIVQEWIYNGPGSPSSIIPGGTTSAFGFESFYDPQSTDGQTTITATIVPFGGGECNILNDTDSERLVYFE